VPYTVKVWATAATIAKDVNDGFRQWHPLINRSLALARLSSFADSTGLRFYGCGLDVKIPGTRRALHLIPLSLITPHLRLMGDGKTPYLGDFREPITTALRSAAIAAYRLLAHPLHSLSLKEAAWDLIENAYLKASDSNQLRAKARQIRYAARADPRQRTKNLVNCPENQKANASFLTKHHNLFV
jgi:hypothetical protein